MVLAGCGGSSGGSENEEVTAGSTNAGFVNAVGKAGIKFSDKDSAIKAGKTVCALMDLWKTEPEVAYALLGKSDLRLTAVGRKALAGLHGHFMTAFEASEADR